MLIGRADDSQTFWGVRSHLSAGTTLDEGDLVPIRAQLFGRAAAYVTQKKKLTGKTLTRDVGKGELVPKDAVAERPCGATLSLSVASATLPGSLAKGQRVNIYVSDKDGHSGRIIDGATLIRVAKPSSGLLAASSQWSLTLRLHESRIESVLAAIGERTLSVAVVALPGTDGDACATPPKDGEVAPSPSPSPSPHTGGR
jgi:hypothetical protein